MNRRGVVGYGGLAGLVCAAGLLGVPSPGRAQAVRGLAGGLLSPLAGRGSEPADPWRWVGLPGQNKPRTDFSIVNLDGRPALRIDADRSYGNLVHPLPADSPGRTLSWRWRVDDALENTDLRTKTGDDTPAKVCTMFDLPTSAIPFVERQVLRISRVRAGELLPGATVCYVWDRKLPPGTVLDNAFTRRVRQIVLRGPEAPLKEWQAESRDVRADFLRLFADETRELPPWLGVAVGADADNTGGRSQAHLRDIVLR